ncbi:hypothetical protein B0J11DRAFT_620455 [Dendryphion nanum]|uniref:Lysine-specific metallo-endopeptidase domain-containing protein n=1 Tax=Dendryphion nanum TaxID=256645 RepID=A0A9P9CXS9_9PLEO|nr:hypothetical protein B0J11DRAFT_620455 [Dendryphion nanum]
MAFTYWIDSTCSEVKSLDGKIIDEVKYMAEAAHKRLNSGADSDFQHVYEYAMKRKKDTNDPVFKSISDFMGDVSAMTLETNRNAANVRFYCDDNEQRWQERTERICNLAFFTKQGTPKPINTLSRIPLVKDISYATAPNIDLDRFAEFVSKTVLHELSHTKPYKTSDHLQAYNWQRNPADKPKSNGPTIADLTADQLATHADVRAIIGQMAVLADRGFTFHRKPREDAGEKEKKDYIEHMDRGWFHKYENISKRSLQIVKRRLTILARRYATI